LGHPVVLNLKKYVLLLACRGIHMPVGYSCIYTNYRMVAELYDIKQQIYNTHTTTTITNNNNNNKNNDNNNDSNNNNNDSTESKQKDVADF